MFVFSPDGTKGAGLGVRGRGPGQGSVSVFRLFLSVSKTLASAVDGTLDPVFAYQVGCCPPCAFGDSVEHWEVNPRTSRQGAEK